jgi:hypothetical protein
MNAYPAEWLYPDEVQSNPNPTPAQPFGLETTLNPPQIQPELNPGPTLGVGTDSLRVVFGAPDLCQVARVSDSAFRKSWLPALEEVAPGQIQVAQGQYSRRAMELVVSLRQARDEGILPRAWVAGQLAHQSERSRMDAAIANADAAGAIVPTEVITLGSEAAQTLALAQSQASLASSFASAVLSRIHDQQLANSSQFASIEAQAVAAQAALQWARRQQIQAQTFAALDAQAQAIQQGAIAAQLQQFQGGNP